MTTCSATNLGSQRVMEPLPGAIITPLREVGVDTLPCWILPRQHAPLTATDDDIQNAIDDRSHLQRTRSASWLCRRYQVFDTIPLTVGQIGWIQLVLVHIPSVPPRLPGCHPFTNRLLGVGLAPKNRRRYCRRAHRGRDRASYLSSIASSHLLIILGRKISILPQE